MVTNKNSMGRILTKVNLLVGLLVLAHLPFLVPYCKQLWQLDHYQFYPFAILGLVWLVRERRDPGRYQWTKASTVLIVIDLLLLALGTALMSVWPVAAGLVCSCAALLLASRERTSNRSLLYLTLLPLIILRMPLNFDLRLINWLQSKTTIAASELLHRLKHAHFRSGNVIEFSDKSLMVEEACSGVQSLFTVLFLAVFIVCWRRRSILHSVLLIISSLFWAGVMNVVRVAGIAIAWKSFNLDLTSGWPHTGWGHVILIISIGLLVSTDALLEGITFFVPDISTESEQLRNPLIALWNRVMRPFLPVHPQTLTKANSNRLAPRYCRSIPIVAFLAIVCVAGQTAQAWMGKTGAASLSLTSSVELFSKSDLPSDLQQWSQSGYTTKTRSLSSSFGQYSNTWSYENGGSTAIQISCDHAFRGWHNLEVCYKGNGWIEEKRQVISLERDGSDVPVASQGPSQDSSDWPAVEVLFRRPSGETSLLVYSFFDAAGNVVRPPETSTGASLVDRILRRSALQFDGFTSATYQVQIFTETPGVLAAAQQDDIRKKHQLSRDLLRDAYRKRR